jgi:hypothetical protein
MRRVARHAHLDMRLRVTLLQLGSTIRGLAPDLCVCSSVFRLLNPVVTPPWTSTYEGAVRGGMSEQTKT